MKNIFIFLSWITCQTYVFSQSNILDSTFGNGKGYVSTNLRQIDAGAWLKALNDSTILAGSISCDNQINGLIVTKYKRDGRLDSAFGNNGILNTGITTTDDFLDAYWEYLNWIVFIPDGKCVILETLPASYTNFIILHRFNKNGTNDNSFGNNGRLVVTIPNYHLNPLAVNVQLDGKILVSGQLIGGNTNAEAETFLLRLNQSGTVDLSFGNNGLAVWQGAYLSGGTSIMTQNNGKILVGGFGIDTAVYNKPVITGMVCFNASGTIDYSFGNGGIIVVKDIQESFGFPEFYLDTIYNKIYIAGESEQDKGSKIRIHRFLINGSIDFTFHGGTVVFSNNTQDISVTSLLVLSNSKIIVSINGDKSWILKYQDNGVLDPGFAANGIYTLNLANGSFITSTDVQPDGKVVFTGFIFNQDADILIGRLSSPTISLIDPNPSMIVGNGSINTDISKIDMNNTVIGAASDSVTKVLLVVESNLPVHFSILNFQSGDGSLSSLSDQTVSASEINITPVNGKAVAIYNVPDGYGNYDPLDGRYITIKAENADGTSQAKLKLVTPPIVLVHGMWSSPKTWIDRGFKDYLEKAGFNSNIIFSASYAAYSATTFDPYSFESLPARKAVQYEIEDALNYYKKNKIASAQVDVVAHSLGGLVTRSFAQNQIDYLSSADYKSKSIHKLITIGTPHRGSPLGPELWKHQDDILYITGGILTLSEFMSFREMPIGSLHLDFGIRSNGIRDLRFWNVKGHTIIGNYKANGNIPEADGFGIMNALLLSFSGKSFNEVFKSECEQSGTLPNDLVVTLNSQSNGRTQLDQFTNFPGYSLFWGTAHTDLPTIHTQVDLNNKLIQGLVVSLLLSQSKEQFSPFTAADEDFTPCQNPTERFSGSQGSSTENRANALNNENKLIKIIAPIRGAIYQKQSPITLQFDVLNGAIPRNATFSVAKVGMFQIPDNPPYSVTFILPQNAPLGKVNISVVAQDTTGILLADTSHIIINTGGFIQNLSVEPQDIFLDSTFRQINLYVHGSFKLNDSLYDEDLTRTSAGTTYSSQKNFSIFKVSDEGLLSALSPGADTLVITNNGKVVKTPVTVRNNYLNRYLYPNRIDFLSISDKLYSDPSFGLRASATSGENVEFDVLTGPVDLHNGIVTIKGTGIVTIKATSHGNVYFAEPIPVIRSFVIQNQTLPIKFTNFSATLKDDGIELKWETEQEENTDFFIIERSIDAIHFDSIGKVNAIENSADKINYHMLDKSFNISQSQVLYYRLKEIDKDKKINISKIVSVKITPSSKVSVFPNPAAKTITITMTNQVLGDHLSIYIYDIIGRLLWRNKLNAVTKQQLNLKNLNSGAYHLIIKNNDITVYHQLLEIIQ